MRVSFSWFCFLFLNENLEDIYILRVGWKMREKEVDLRLRIISKVLGMRSRVWGRKIYFLLRQIRRM